jgi:hypothetical protein
MAISEDGSGNSSSIENPPVTKEEKVNKANEILSMEGGQLAADANDQLL